MNDGERKADQGENGMGEMAYSEGAKCFEKELL